MGRQKLQPPSMTFQQWLDSGRPPLELSTQQLADWIVPSISKQRVHIFCTQGALFKEGSKIHTDHPTNAEWLQGRIGCAPPPRDSGGRKGGAAKLKGKTETPRGEVANLGSLDLEAILAAISQRDMSLLNGADIQKVARLETALKTRVERQTKRGLLIERSLVQSVFGRLYQIHMNEARTIGAKVAPDVAGEMGIEDAASILRVEEKIDGEILKVLAHIKRLFDDFLIGVGSEAV